MQLAAMVEGEHKSSNYSCAKPFAEDLRREVGAGRHNEQVPCGGDVDRKSKS